MCPPGSEPSILHDHPIAFRERFDGGADGGDFEHAFVAGDGRGSLSSEQRGEGWFGGIDALDLVYICGVYGCSEGAEEEG